MEQNNEQNNQEKQSSYPALEISLPTSLLKVLPPAVKFELEKLSPGKKAEFLIRYNSELKTQSPLVWLFALSCHYWYLNAWKLQLLYWLTLGGFGLWTLVDMFRLTPLLKQYNDKLAAATLEIVKNHPY